MIVPWGFIANDIQGSSLSHEPRTLEFERRVSTPDSAEIISKTILTIYPKEQLAFSENHYHKTLDGKMIAKEKETLPFRWYHRYEMELFLQKVGFSVTNIWNASFDPHLMSTIYQGKKE